MQHAARLPTVPTRRSIIAPLLALLLGAGLAVGGYALVDDQNGTQVQEEVVFVDLPGPGQGVRGIDDMATSTSATPNVIPYLSQGQGSQTLDGPSAKHESSTAGAIGSGGQDSDTAIASDPHGPAAQLHAP
jgi:hypothetical protein